MGKQVVLSLKTHTHTHTHIYIYIYIYLTRVSPACTLILRTKRQRRRQQANGYGYGPDSIAILKLFRGLQCPFSAWLGIASLHSCSGGEREIDDTLATRSLQYLLLILQPDDDGIGLSSQCYHARSGLAK